MRRSALVLVVAGLLAMVVTPPALADPEDVANDISSEIMSPFCPGVTLHDCPSDSATDLRQRIVGWAEDGLGRDAIMTRLEDEYGRSIYARPPGRSGTLAWVIPLLLGLGAAGAGWVVLRRVTRAEAAPTHIAPEDHRRFEREMASFRSAAGLPAPPAALDGTEGDGPATTGRPRGAT